MFSNFNVSRFIQSFFLTFLINLYSSNKEYEIGIGKYVKLTKSNDFQIYFDLFRNEHSSNLYR